MDHFIPQGVIRAMEDMAEFLHRSGISFEKARELCEFVLSHFLAQLHTGNACRHSYNETG